MNRTTDPKQWRPSKACYVDSVMYIPDLVRSTGGVGVYYSSPNWLARRERDDGLVLLPFGKELELTYRLFTPTDRIASEASNALVAAVRRTFTA